MRSLEESFTGTENGVVGVGVRPWAVGVGWPRGFSAQGDSIVDPQLHLP